MVGIIKESVGLAVMYVLGVASQAIEFGSVEWLIKSKRCVPSGPFLSVIGSSRSPDFVG